ncbi:3D (Asp-Asp-Asp) domain-containing protein [Streptomyces albogriseolus]
MGVILLPNCGCSQRCTCRVTAGPGVTVDGNGSPGTPYVISAPGSSGAVSVQDGTCVTLAGDGTPADPLTPGLMLDPAAGNLAQCGPGGLLVQAPAAAPTVVEAGTNVTVSGTGTAADPYVVNADPVTCDDVRPCLAAGPGVDYDPATGVISAEPTVVEAGTNVTVSGTGTAADPYVVSAAGGGGVSTVVQAADTPTVDTTVTGDGSPGDPYEVSAAVILDPAPPGGGTNLVHAGPDGLYTECADVRGCLAAGDGITYDAGTGVIAAEGTVVEAGTGVTVTGSGTTADPYEVSTVPLETGCGLTGDGSSTSPLAAVVAAWPYACDVDANAGGVYCDSTGQLRSEPRGSITFQQDQQVLDFADVAVPAPQDTEVATHTITVNNPDPCRPAFVIMEGEADADFVLPVGAGAALGIATDETWYLRNTGTTAMNDTHAQATKVVNGGTIAPGGSLNFTLSIRMGRGSGGATYNRVQSFLRAFIIVL